MVPVARHVAMLGLGYAVVKCSVTLLVQNMFVFLFYVIYYMRWPDDDLESRKFTKHLKT